MNTGEPFLKLQGTLIFKSNLILLLAFVIVELELWILVLPITPFHLKSQTYNHLSHNIVSHTSAMIYLVMSPKGKCA